MAAPVNPYDMFYLDIQEYARGGAMVTLRRDDDHMKKIVHYQLVFEDALAGYMPDPGLLDDLIDIHGLLGTGAYMTRWGHNHDPNHGRNTRTYEIELTDTALQRLRGNPPGTLAFSQAAKAMQQMSRAISAAGTSIAKIDFTPVDSKPPKIVKKVQTEVEIGYRDFIVAKKGNLVKPTLLSRNGIPWPKYQPLIASCSGDVFKPHDAPHVGCQCGIYAFKMPTHHDLKSDANIWGEIALWGKVIVCGVGFRAQYAYPQNIFVKDVGTETVRRFRDDIECEYGVPVHLVKERDGKKASELMADMLDEWLKDADKH